MSDYEITKLIEKIRKYARDNNIRAYHVPEMANLGTGSTSNMFKDTWNPTKDTLLAIEKAFEKHAKNLNAQ